jgi:hypothetical protein
MNNSTETTIAATVAALRDILQESATLALSAHAALAAGKRNLAIGNLLPLEQLLPTAQALFGASLTLHRRNPAQER